MRHMKLLDMCFLLGAYMQSSKLLTHTTLTPPPIYILKQPPNFLLILGVGEQLCCVLQALRGTTHQGPEVGGYLSQISGEWQSQL